MWWYKIPVLLTVATASHISLSDKHITKLRARSLFTAYLPPAFEGCLWTLTVCEVALIWSVNNLRSPVAHRILVFLVHPWANFPPNLRISLPFSIGWSISIFSLAIHLIFNSHHQRARQSSAPLDQVRDVSRRRSQITRPVFLIPAMAIGSTLCFVGPGSFVNECRVWRVRFWGTVLCLIGVIYVVFWLVVIWRFAGAQDGGGTVSPDTRLEGSTEVLVMEAAE